MTRIGTKRLARTLAVISFSILSIVGAAGQEKAANKTADKTADKAASKAPDKAVGVRAVQSAVADLPADVKPPQRWALVIAGGEYDDKRIPDLPQCENDGKAIETLLVDPGRGLTPVDHMRRLAPGEITRAKVIAGFEWLAANAKPEDLVVVYYSGHGATDKRGAAYWLMKDSDIDSLRGTALPELDVTDLLGQIKTSRLVVLIDACYAASTANLPTRSTVNLNEIYPAFDGQGRIAITSANGQELSLVIDQVEHPGHGYSVFTWHLMEALEGKGDADRDGLVTVNEAWDYVSRQVPRTAGRLDGKMTPQLKGQLGGQFLLTVNADALLAKQKEYIAAEATRQGRLDSLKALALEKKLSVAHYQEGRRLLAARVLVAEADRLCLAEYVRMLDGELPIDKLSQALKKAKAAGEGIFDKEIASPLGAERAGEVREFLQPKIAMCWCPPGEFTMGSPPGETDQDHENQVEVTLDYGFWLSQTEVTQGMWTSIMKSAPWSGQDHVKSDPDCPAVYISHGGQRGASERDSAQYFCAMVNEREEQAGRLAEGWNYRLPTEAEWEYACRAGTQTRWSFGPTEEKMHQYAWFKDNASDAGEEFAHQVGLKKPNPWNLCDMHGNVWEWCRDRWHKKLEGGRNPEGGYGPKRVFRGGDYSRQAGFSRSGCRNMGNDFTYRAHYLGFRLALARTISTTARSD